MNFILRIAKLLIFLFLSINSLFGQNEKVKGKWKVINWIVISRDVNISPQSRRIFMEDSLQCVKEVFVISDKGIYTISPENRCDFDICGDSLQITSKSKVEVYNENDTSILYVENVIESGMIGSRLANKMGVRRRAFWAFTTNCLVEWGNEFYLKILIINRKRIGLYRGGDIILLKRT